MLIKWRPYTDCMDSRKIAFYDHEKRHSSLNFKAAQSVLLTNLVQHHPFKEAAFLALGKWLCLDDLNLQHMSHMLGKLFAFEAKKVIARIRKYIKAFLSLSFELTVVATINLPKKLEFQSFIDHYFLKKLFFQNECLNIERRSIGKLRTWIVFWKLKALWKESPVNSFCTRLDELNKPGRGKPQHTRQSA